MLVVHLSFLTFHPCSASFYCPIVTRKDTDIIYSPEKLKKRFPRLLLYVGTLTGLFAVLGLSFFVLGPAKFAHADPIAPGGNCLSVSPLKGEPGLEKYHSALVTATVKNVCMEPISNVLVSLQVSAFCIVNGKDAKSSAPKVESLAFGTIQPGKKVSLQHTVPGYCIDCIYQKRILQDTTYPPFVISIYPTGVIGTTPGGLATYNSDLSSPQGVQVKLPNEFPSPFMSPDISCPPIQPTLR